MKTMYMIIDKAPLVDALWEQNEMEIVDRIERITCAPLDDSLMKLIRYIYRSAVYDTADEMEKILSQDE